MPSQLPNRIVRGMEPTLKVGDAGAAVADRIRNRRDAKGLSVREVAKRTAAAGRPLHASGIVKIEAKARRVDIDDLVAIAEALGERPSDLLTGDFRDIGHLPMEWLRQNSRVMKPVLDAVEQAKNATPPDDANSLTFEEIISYVRLFEFINTGGVSDA